MKVQLFTGQVVADLLVSLYPGHSACRPCVNHKIYIFGLGIHGWHLDLKELVASMAFDIDTPRLGFNNVIIG